MAPRRATVAAMEETLGARVGEAEARLLGLLQEEEAARKRLLFNRRAARPRRVTRYGRAGWPVAGGSVDSGEAAPDAHLSADFSALSHFENRALFPRLRVCVAHRVVQP